MPETIQAGREGSIQIRCGHCDADPGVAHPPLLGTIHDGEVRLSNRSRRDELHTEPAPEPMHRGGWGNSSDRPAPRSGPRQWLRACPRCGAEHGLIRHDIEHAEQVAAERGWTWLLVDGVGRLRGPHGERIPTGLVRR